MIVGVVTTSYPRGDDDWAGGFVRARVRALAASGAEVEVIAAGDGPGADLRVPAPAPGLFGGSGAPEFLAAARARGVIAALGFAARLTSAIAARAGRWQAVESHWLAPCALAVAAAAPGRPHRAFAHGGDVALLERIPGGSSLARALRAVDLTFASADLRDRFARLAGVTGLTATVEPAPFDDGLFVAAPADRRALRAELGCHGRTFLCVGRLVPVKGFDLLVRAVGRLPPPRPSLVLVGEGPERARLAAMADARRVTLRLPGALPPRDVARWMRAADVYVQPSRRREGSPLAVREALAVGLPVVATAVGGLTELAANSAGPTIRLVTPEDPAALAAALAHAL